MTMMLRFGWIVGGLLFGSLSVQAQVTEHHADRDGALGVARGPAADAIKAELTRPNQTCTGMDFKPRPCALADNALNADVHYGASDASGRRIAFVSVRWQSDPTGNAVEAKGMVLVAEGGADFQLLGTTALSGDEVADVRFEPSRITYETGYLRPGHARATPTGRRRYEIPLKPDGIGPVAIQRTGFGPSPSQPAVAQALDTKDALAVVRRLYEAGESYDRIFQTPVGKANGPAEAVLTSGLIAHISTTMALSDRCPIYDGDPRLGGAQGAGGPTRARYALDKATSTLERVLVRVSARQRDNPGVTNAMIVTLIATRDGWRIDDIAPRTGESYRSALASAHARCRKNP